MIGYDDLYQATDDALNKLSSISDYPSWSIDDLKELDSSKQYTLDDFKSAMADIDSKWYNGVTDNQWH